MHSGENFIAGRRLRESTNKVSGVICHIFQEFFSLPPPSLNIIVISERDPPCIFLPRKKTKKVLFSLRLTKLFLLLLSLAKDVWFPFFV